VVIHARVTADWLLQKIALQIGVENPDGDKLRLLGQLYERLVSIHQAGRHAVVLIDEAQMLGTRELMEEFRGLLNLEYSEKRLITFIFLGLPEIEEMLKSIPARAAGDVLPAGSVERAFHGETSGTAWHAGAASSARRAWRSVARGLAPDHHALTTRLRTCPQETWTSGSCGRLRPGAAGRAAPGRRRAMRA
jgi:hypothetical protein